MRSKIEVPQYTSNQYPTDALPLCFTSVKPTLHISVLNGALWDMDQVHSGICEFGLLPSRTCEASLTVKCPLVQETNKMHVLTVTDRCDNLQYDLTPSTS